MEIKPLYLFYGDEAYLIEKDLKIFRSHFKAMDCAVEEFDGVKDNLDSILDAVATDPLFGSRRLIIVKNSPWFANAKKQEGDKAKSAAENIKKQRQEIEEYCQNPNENVCLVFVAASASKTLKAVKAIAALGKVREYKKPREWELGPYLRQYLRREGRSIFPGALDLFITIGGEDLGSLISQCDKLVLYTQGRDNITEEDVAKVVSQGAEASIFQLSDALGSRDVNKVRSLCNNILAETKTWEYPKLFGYITNYIRLLMRIKEYSEAGYGESQIASATKINSYRVKLGIPAAKRYTMAELAQGLRLMLEVDYKLKSGISDFSQTFPVALMTIAGGK